MKKFLIVLLALCLMCAPALAEETALVDVTGVVTGAIAMIAGVMAALLGYVWRRWVQPWLEQRELMDVAEIVVNAVEAIMGRYNGNDKWVLALDKMAAYGFKVDSIAVEEALLAAWKKLDLSQMMAGEKEPPDKETGGDVDA